MRERYAGGRSSNESGTGRRTQPLMLWTVALLVLVAAPLSAEEIVTVPGDQPTLSAAISAVPDGGTIEMAAGTYPSPGNGFVIANLGKGFTIRAAEGATVVLDGGDSRPVLEIDNATRASGGPVVFENLIFRNGFVASGPMAGAVSVTEGDATFIGCTFESSRSETNQTGGGAAGVFNNSVVHFIESTFRDNSASQVGGALKVTNGVAYIHRSTFERNRTNLPGHASNALGGAIHVGTLESATTLSKLFITNSLFRDNESGFAGGAVYVSGRWVVPWSTARSEVVVANSLFEDNLAVNDPGVTTASPPEGGALSLEDQARFRVYSSRFYDNISRHGGAAAVYRGEMEFYDTIFRGNRNGAGTNRAQGGTIKAISDDVQSADGNNNYPTARLSLTDSYLEGRSSGSDPAPGESGGCILAAGDFNRQFGQGGATQLGTRAQNQVQVMFDNVVMTDCDAVAGTISTGTGGGLNATLANVSGSDLMVLDSDVEDSGGGVFFAILSDIDLNRLTVAGNTAENFGAGFYDQGAVLDITNSLFLHNEISPGVSENIGQSTGAGVYTAGWLPGPEDTTGTISSSTISGNIGAEIWEGDRNAGPINDVRYNGNTIFETQFNGDVYWNGLIGARNVTELNSLVITRSGAANTAKSQVDNIGPAQVPSVGAVQATPPRTFQTVAVGETGPSPAYLGWAWEGNTANLQGAGITNHTGYRADNAGTYALNVDGGQVDSATISNAQATNVTFSGNPIEISSGQLATLSWSTAGSGFVDLSIDQGVGNSLAANGSIQVTPVATTTYTLIGVTAEGGDLETVTIFVDEPSTLDVIFQDGFESGNTSSWTATIPGS
ncbi:MAG: hypothetical protein AAGM22_03420 [Acidobacteriota bacterium]